MLAYLPYFSYLDYHLGPHQHSLIVFISYFLWLIATIWGSRNDFFQL